MKIGRIRRKNYLISSILIIGLTLLITQNLDLNKENDLGILATSLIVLIIINFILNIGRLHDINLSGWYSLLIFLPIINFGLIALYFIDSSKGDNKYGKDPKGRINEKLISPNQNIKTEKKDDYKSLKLIDNNLKLLQESYNEGILDNQEFSVKKDRLLNEKQKLIEKIENENILSSKIEKLKGLLLNEIINQSEYNNKTKELYLKYGEIPPTVTIDLNTKFYYVHKAKEYGPFPAKEIIRLINLNKISSNCLVRIENENNYNMRAYEISKMVEIK